MICISRYPSLNKNKNKHTKQTSMGNNLSMIFFFIAFLYETKIQIGKVIQQYQIRHGVLGVSLKKQVKTKSCICSAGSKAYYTM